MKKVAYSDIKDWGMPPAHFNMRSARLQGKVQTGLESFWCAISEYEPGGGVEWSGEDSPEEKVYVVLKGELTIKGKDEEFVLGPKDSLYIGPNEGRSVVNNGKEIATLLVVVST